MTFSEINNEMVNMNIDILVRLKVEMKIQKLEMQSFGTDMTVFLPVFIDKSMFK